MRLPPLDTKARHVLDFFLTGRSSNRFEAERRLHDHCLHSTVSTLQNTFGIEISRRIEIVPGYRGKPTRCCRYWIDEEERQRIKEKAPTSSGETNGGGFPNFKANDNAGVDAGQYDDKS